MTFNLFSRFYLHCSTKRLLGQLPNAVLTLLPRHRQCGGSGSVVAVGSSVLQDVAKHSRTVSHSHTSFLHPFVHCARVNKKV